jgi:hypothetical protein
VGARTASSVVALAAGCSLTQPVSGSYSCDANGNCLDGFLCNAQNLCVSAVSSSTGTTGRSIGAKCPGAGPLFSSAPSLGSLAG